MNNLLQDLILHGLNAVKGIFCNHKRISKLSKSIVFAPDEGRTQNKRTINIIIRNKLYHIIFIESSNKMEDIGPYFCEKLGINGELHPITELQTCGGLGNVICVDKRYTKSYNCYVW